MLLDSTTARIHWEMVAQADPSLPGPSGPGGGGTPEIKHLFLSTARGLTRQLRTTFAPPPELPPPPRRVLRVLVIADPAEDDRLPGAEQEGIEVAELFEAFGRAVEVLRLAEPKNPLYANGVEVVQLLGPRQATRTNVFRELALRPYDVLHYAGHCVYDAQHPSSSGWIFTGGERLSVNELRRIDNIPKFVFSNACESGITPDRAELRTPELAPSFAEAFFERGVANFVCTAWPVDDVAARRFALTLYRNLLGLVPVDRARSPGTGVEVEGAGRDLVGTPLRDRGEAADGPGLSAHRLAGEVMPMHRAMREARLAIAKTYNGGRTWGAYQHYGSPNFRFFDHERWTREAAPRQPDAGAGTDTAKNGKIEAGASPIAGEAPIGVEVVARARDATQDANTEGINPETHPEKIASAVSPAESDVAAAADPPIRGRRPDEDSDRGQVEATTGALHTSWKGGQDVRVRKSRIKERRADDTD
jgi:CHAT domain